MSDSSRLSSRFKKRIEQENAVPEQQPPRKFVFPQKKTQNISVELMEQPPLQELVHQEITADIEEKHDNFLETQEAITNALLEKISFTPVWYEYDLSKRRELIRNFIFNKLSVDHIELEDNERDLLTDKLYRFVEGFGPVQNLLDRDNVDAVFVNGLSGIYIEIGGKVLNTEIKPEQSHIDFLLNHIYDMADINIADVHKNILNLKIKNYFVTIILPPLSGSGVNISIRKSLNFDINFLLNKSMMTKEILDFLISVVNSNKNIVISGDINSGKTTLTGVLLNSMPALKRIVLMEEASEISHTNNSLIKFMINSRHPDYQKLVSSILKLEPDYVVCDLNFPVSSLSEIKGGIYTLRANCIDAALSKLISSYVCFEHMPEKMAKTKVLSDFDYIVQINKFPDGSRRVTSVVELTPARTSALSVKTVAKLVDNLYVTEIPQPLTSILADSLISQ